MIIWIRRCAWIFGAFTFFLTLGLSLNYSDLLNLQFVLPAVIKALCFASLFWFAGFVAGDILLKGLVTDIATEKDDLLEGGLLQRLHNHKEQNKPGGSEIPLIELPSGKEKKEAEQKSQSTNK